MLKGRRTVLLEALRPLVSPALMRRPPAGDMLGPADDNAGLLIATYNVHKCVGQDGIFDPWRIMAVIGEIGADVIALQEADQRFGDRAGLLDLAAIEREHGLIPVRLRPTRSSHGWHGNLVLFREGVVTSARQLALPGVEPRGAVIADLNLPAGSLRVVAAHLGLLRRSRARQIETILKSLEADHHLPTLLMGDLNEWRLGRRSSLTALSRVFGPFETAAPSFPSRFPVLALDRIIGNQPGLVARVAVHDTPLARIASDHLPIKARIRLATAEERKERVGGLATAA